MGVFRGELVELFGEWMIEDIETIEDWLGREIEVIPKTHMKTDRASREFDEIELGLRGKSTHRKFRPMLRKRLVHEALHLKGLGHDREAREMEYYSNIGRDKYSEKVMAEELGWGAPEEELYEEYSQKGDLKQDLRERRKNESKFIVFCPKCGREWYRRKKSSLVKFPSDYVCDECGTKLRSKTKDGSEVKLQKGERVYKYGCPECDLWNVVHRKTKTVKNIDNYRCKKCGGDLAVKLERVGEKDRKKTRKLTEYL